jgi:hypothetical protein
MTLSVFWMHLEMPSHFRLSYTHLSLGLERVHVNDVHLYLASDGRRVIHLGKRVLRPTPHVHVDLFLVGAHGETDHVTVELDHLLRRPEDGRVAEEVGRDTLKAKLVWDDGLVPAEKDEAVPALGNLTLAVRVVDLLLGKVEVEGVSQSGGGPVHVAAAAAAWARGRSGRRFASVSLNVSNINGVLQG